MTTKVSLIEFYKSYKSNGFAVNLLVVSLQIAELANISYQ